ncbi:MAG: hypothetical protein ACE5GA_09880 [Candidatus Zixiibacteriota bacterium]
MTQIKSERNTSLGSSASIRISGGGASFLTGEKGSVRYFLPENPEGATV